ncbi:hypothetical protein StoSoilB5_30600 [Arthrobacter sp. StoSoilB5]|nr:hypothetical protein StoSoilB5_00740 [Arthrobacter sp. StoSoilB5]BCW45876.1 hypothetical protein StoSoilB5_30600 [Arthrobacter sp. StoSoilB5]
MVIDGMVDERVPTAQASVRAGAFSQIPGPGVRFPGHPAKAPMAAAIGDPAELLHIDVDHFPGPGVFIAAGAFSADPDPGGTVRETQGWAVIAVQDPMDRGDVQVQVVSDPGRSPALGRPKAHDAMFYPH